MRLPWERADDLPVSVIHMYKMMLEDCQYYNNRSRAAAVLPRQSAKWSSFAPRKHRHRHGELANQPNSGPKDRDMIAQGEALGSVDERDA